jgi:hypothetical protein
VRPAALTLTDQPLGHKALSKDPQQKIARHLSDCVGLLVKREVAGIKDVEQPSAMTYSRHRS